MRVKWGSGIVYAVSAYFLWGLLPLYWKLLKTVPATEILAHRIVWAFVFFAILMWLKKERKQLVELVRKRKNIFTLVISALLVSSNWGAYIYAVNSGQVLEASLGYFISPLMNVCLGLVFFKERLGLRKWLAVSIAALGVLILGAEAQRIPSLALFLAVTFSLYALVRKKLGAGGLVGMTVETLILAPLALAFLWGLAAGQPADTPMFRPWDIFGLLALGGVMTGVPLLWYTEAAIRLPLSTLGLCQYISPSIQFLLAVLLYREPFSVAKASGFVVIWIALTLYSIAPRRAQILPS